MYFVSFSVENFKSIGDRQTFYMDVPSGVLNTKKVRNCIITKNKEYKKLVPCACIYGPNASGKTKFVDAIFEFTTFFKIPLRELSDTITFQPFAFDKSFLDRPTVFEIEFVIEKIFYKYSFSFNEKSIITEKLEKNGNTVYNIADVNDIDFDKNFPELDKNLCKEIVNKIKNKTYVNLFLREFVNEGKSDILNDIFMFFKTKIFIKNNSKSFGRTIDVFDKYKNDIINFVQKSDNCIQAMESETKIFDKSNEDKMMDFAKLSTFNLVGQQIVLDGGAQGFKIKQTKINVINKNGTPFNFGDCSDGTKLLFALSGFLVDILQNGGILFFDELDKSLHPELLIYLVRLFNDKKINKGNGQLVFTARNDILLDSSYNIFRDYQIYFMNKNSRQMSELYSLYEFSDILMNYKKKNIAKLYRKGLFGARPVLEDFYWRE